MPSGAGGSAGPQSSGSGARRGGPGQTADERRAAIDRRLDDSFGVFDATLRKEQQQNAQERDARQSTTSSGSADGTEGQSSDKSGSGSKDSSGSANTETPQEGDKGEGDKQSSSGKQGNSDKRSSRPGDLKSEKAGSASTGKNTENEGNGAGARNIPDGSDDDVVARRLRKAAETETDPELKDKLWKEYIEYKKNAHG